MPRFAPSVLLALALAAPVLAQDAPRLRGSVVDADGKGIAGVVVSVVDAPWDRRELASAGAPMPSKVLASATTDETGAFALDASKVPAGLRALKLEAPGRAPLVRAFERIAFGATALPADLRIALPPVVTLEGMVLDASGAPAGKVSVAVAAASALGDALASTRTGDDGRFRIEGLPALGDAKVLAERNGATARAGTRLPLSGSLRLALHLRAAREIAGVVVTQDAEPKPVAGARIVVLRAPRAGGQGATGAPAFFGAFLLGGLEEATITADVATGADGSFRVQVPPGAEALLFQPGYAPRFLQQGKNPARVQAPIAGTVLTAAKPVAGARVRLGRYPIETTTDARGAFTLPFEEGELRVTGPSGSVSVSPVRSTTARLFLPKPRALGAVIVEAPTADAPDGKPLAGALVRIAATDDWDAVTATDAQGRIALTLPEEPGILTVTNGSVALETDLGDADLDKEQKLVVSSPSLVALRVTSQGKPAASALVIVTRNDAPRLPLLARAGADGIVKVTGLPPGMVTLRAALDGAIAGETQRPALPAAALGRVSADPLDLSVAGRLKVRCLDASGRPLEGVLVVARSEQQDPRMRFRGGGPGGPGGGGRGSFGEVADTPMAGSGPDGVATLDAFAPGECLRLTASRPGFASAEEACARPAAGAGASLDMKLDKGATVHGVVLDPDGAPVPLARVVARPDSATASGAGGGGPRDRFRRMTDALGSATADATGAFVMNDVRPGRVELVAQADGFLDGDAVPADLLSGDDAEVQLHVARGATVSGVVLTAKGEPADGARVSAMPAGMMPRMGGRGPRGQFGGAQAGPDGTFVIEGLEPGADVAVQADRDGERSDRRVVAPGGDPVTLKLNALGRIEGRVLGVEDLEAEIMIECMGAPEGSAATRADAEGLFALGGLPAGTWACTATAGDQGEGVAENLAVREGDTTSGTIKLGPRTMQDVVVRDAASGEPLPGAWIVGDRQRATADMEGRARVALNPRPPPDGQTLFVQATGYRASQTRVPSPRPAVLDVKLSSSAAVRGTVVDADGNPVAGIEVRGAGNATTGADGRFELTPRGQQSRLTLSAERTMDGVIEKGSVDVELDDEGAEGVVLRLERLATGSALVVVSDGSGPVKGAQVALVHESSPARRDVQDARMVMSFGEGLGASGTTDEEGSFLADSLRPGELTILAGREGESTVRAAGTVQVASGSQATASVRIPDGKMVTGRVVRAGAGVEGIAVLVQSGESTSGRDGSLLALTASLAGGEFRAGPLPESLARVVVRATPTDSADRGVDAEAVPGGPPVTLDIQGCSVTGRVTADGAGADGAQVTARPADGSGSKQARTKPDGSFVIAGLDPSARYDVSATLPGRAPASKAATTAPAGAVDVGVLELGAGELTGTARATGGSLGDGFMLALLRADGTRLPAARVTVQPDGTWRQPAPAGERLTYRAFAQGFAPIVSAAEPGAPIALSFTRGAELTIEVLQPDGRPAAGASAQLVSWNDMPVDEHLVVSRLPSSQGWFSRSDERGLLTVGPLAPGTSVIRIARDALVAQVSVALAEGDSKRVTATLGAP